MKPEKWGPHAWIFLHTITFNYPIKPTEEDKYNMKQFINSLGNVLPCEKCREHFRDNLVKYPLTDEILNNKNKLIYWMIDIHNSVNRMNGKKEIDYDTAVKKITGYYESNYNSIIYIFGIFCIILVITILVKIKYIK